MTPAPVTETGSVATETLPAPSRVDQGLRWFTSILLLIFPTATLFVNRGDSYVLGLLTLIGIWVWLRDGARRWLDRPSALLWIAFVLFFAVALLSYLLGTQTDAGFRFLGRYLRFLLIAPVYLALRRYPPTAKTMFIGLALGALLAGVIGGLHFYHADTVIRIEATTDLSIVFGDLATTITLCAVAAFALLIESRKKWATPLLVTCIAGGIAATLLSGTRGAWVPLLVLLIALITPFNKILKISNALRIVFALVIVIGALFLAGGNHSRQRITNIDREFYDYFVVTNYTRQSKNQGFSTADCVNNPVFLDAWLASGFVPFGTLNIRVQSDPRIVHETTCKNDKVIRLYNPSAKIDQKGVPYITLLRFPGSMKKLQRTTLWMRGAGFVTLDYKGRAALWFKSDKYEKVSLVVNDDSLGVALNVGTKPGNTVWLVPAESYVGEYTIPIIDNSVGQRLEMWRAASEMFLNYPLLGVGTGAYQHAIAGLIQKGEILPFVGSFDHPHNDYFNALASAGIVGFLALLVIFAVPLVRFWRAVRGKDSVTHAVGLAGALTVLGFAIYALTDTIFLHSMMITWYVVYMALFYALLDARAGKLASPEPPKQ